MSESELDCVLIRDSRIQNISDRCKFGVWSGPASTTYQQFNSVSAASSSMLSFSVRPPSESVVIDRNIYVGATVKFNLTINNDAGHGGINVFNYGVNCALQSFPLNRMFQTVTANINNAAVSLNSQDVLPGILRMMSTDKLQEYQYTTPTMMDNYLNYPDMLTATGGAANINNPLLGYVYGEYQKYLMPRGCHPVNITIGDVTWPAAGAHTFVSDNGNAQTWVIPITVTLFEPLILSPFLFGGFSYGKAGFIGINNLNLTMNLDSTLRRFFSAASPVVPEANKQGYSLSLTSVTDAYIYMNFLSTQPTSIIKSLNVLPFYDMPRYIVGTANTPAINANASATITVANIQINQIPDKFIIYARKPIASVTARDSDTFLQINSISVNFNNQSGLLSTATQFQLWQMSVRNGLQMNWYEFSGLAQGNYTCTANETAINNVYNTCGSVLILNPALDLSLPPYLSCGSLGQYTMQFQINLTNNYSTAVTPEIVVVCLNAGIFQTVSGNSAYYSGLLSKEKVLESQKEGHRSVSDNSIMRLVGGSCGSDLHDMASSALQHVPVLVPKIRKQLLEEIHNYSGSKLGKGTSGGRSRLQKLAM